MRLWSIHPKYLDRAGLLALWREGLLAKKVLEGKTKGYRNHPQLERFRNQRSPSAAISTYLLYVWKEGVARGYEFDKSKLGSKRTRIKIKVTQGQLEFEFRHLLGKLKKRGPERLNALSKVRTLKPHPSFSVVKCGLIESWEKSPAALLTHGKLAAHMLPPRMIPASATNRIAIARYIFHDLNFTKKKSDFSSGRRLLRNAAFL